MTVLKEVIARYETDGRIVKCFDIGELIRCKDCKWYDEGCNEEESWTWCKSNEMSVEEDFFCRDGERKEE